MSPFIYTPFYFTAIYAFICEKEWIRVPGVYLIFSASACVYLTWTDGLSVLFTAALMWAWGMFLVLLACIREQLEGPYKTSNLPVIAAAYGGYIIIPLLVMVRMASTPAFCTDKEKLT